MTRDELQKVANLLWKSDMTNYNDAMLKAEEILDLFKDWKSPEEVQSICEAYFHTLYGHSMKEVSEMMKEGR